MFGSDITWHKHDSAFLASLEYGKKKKKGKKIRAKEQLAPILPQSHN